ncbi:thiamine phosphate synthase [Roseibium sp. CAU 1637]|uniref:Thiamine-phosphate synthase n=1 Tax=Roseibium limicola TaxID=2816037 RepID=A0A939J7Z4_9HYPH|nr:thiamine phosphate synthase [Roseibium limicola]MBO0344766.1 thiamine phosphate synthase [Roseibium limicola]
MLHPFYLIVDDPQWISRLAPAGLKLVQLRIKNKSGDALMQSLRQGLTVARNEGITLVINDHWQLAIDLKAEWLHLGQEDLEDADLKALRRAGVRIGISTHTLDELDRALSFEPDYIAIGPVFPARGKQVDYPSLGASGIAKWRQKVTCPLVAIGGIRLEQATELRAAGADSLCVITDVLADVDPAARCRAWINATL